MTDFSIGEIAQRAHIETSTIRYYERIALLPRAKRVNGRRLYDEDVLKHLALIRATKAAGFTIAEIQTLTAIWDKEGRSPKNWREFVERKLAETKALISAAQKTQEILNSALSCGCWDYFTIPLDEFISTISLESAGDGSSQAQER